ncbi:pentapeptide repeat-containing protein, partial [Mycobacterium marinum]
NTGWGNAGAYNSGGFNAGAYNTGSFNPGHVNTGWFNTGDINTGLGNSGNINTGAFVSGDMNNGFFWRGTGQGLIGADYTITIPQIPLTIGGGGILNIPITGAITGLTVQSFTVHGVGSAATPIPVNLHLNVDGESGGATVSVHIPNTDVSFDVHVDGLPITLDLPLDSEVRPIVVPDIPISRIPIVLSLGSDSTSLNTAIGAGIGPISIPILDLPTAPGFGNATDSPSSGFFNSGPGGVSGFGNVGDTLSGVWNFGSYASGLQNYGGSLLSGITNLGGATSGVGNTSDLGLAIAGVISGIGNVGSQLSGLFLEGSVP